MIVAIHHRNNLVSNFRMGEPNKTKLRPGLPYWLRMYASQGQRVEDSDIPMPIERGDLMVIRRSRMPDKQYEPETPPKAGPLLLRVQFRVDNDAPISRMIRWTFAQEKGDEYQTSRVILQVLPRRRSQLVLLLSLFGVFWLSYLMEITVAAAIGEQSGLMIRTAIALGITVLYTAGGLVFLRCLEWWHTPTD